MEDISEIVKMCGDLNREDPGPRPVPESNTLRTLEMLRAEPVRGKAVVLEIDGIVVGYAFLISFWSNELGGAVCNIDEFYVKLTYRSQGHGRSLFQALITENSLWPEKPVAIELEVTPQNDRARAFYASLGFEEVRNAHMRFLFQ